MNCIESKRGVRLTPLPSRLRVTIFSRRLLGLNLSDNTKNAHFREAKFQNSEQVGDREFYIPHKPVIRETAETTKGENSL